MTYRFAIPALIIVAALCGTPTAGLAASMIVGNQLLNDASVRLDIETYASMFEVDLETAALQMGEVDAVAELEAALVSEYPDAFGGIWIEHLPYGVTVAMTDAGAPKLDAALASVKLSVPPRVQRVKHSLEDLVELEESIATMDLGPANLSVNVTMNRVEIDTLSASAARSRLPVNLQWSDVIHLIEMPSLGGTTANIYGGLGGSEHGWVGCPSGFTVRQVGSATDGVLTAGHCSNTPYSYLGVNLPFVAEWAKTDADAEWHRVPGFVAQPEFVYLPDQSRRFVTATKTRASIQIGELVCHYGPASGYGCGNVDSKTFRAFDIPNASATFIRAGNCNQDLSLGGDSGGPIFKVNTAYGIMSGNEIDIFCGGHTKMVFTAADLAVSHLNVAIKLH